MLIGKDGAVTASQEQFVLAQQAAEEKENKERKRIAGLSNTVIEREVRQAIKKIGVTNHLTFCNGLGLILLLNAKYRGTGDPRRLSTGLFKGNDPYYRTYPARGKTTRKKAGRPTAQAQKAA